MSRTMYLIANVLGLLVFGIIVLYLLVRSLKKSEEPGKLLFRWLLTFILIAVGIYTIRKFPPFAWPIVAAAFGLPIAVIWARSIGEMVAAPFGSLMTGGNDAPEPTPFYSIAEARRKQGQFDESIRLIRAQLEKFPGDFTGMMLIATIQAEDQKDVQGAQRTIEQLVSDSSRPPQAIASALHALADWHLALQDPDSARLPLERILELYPDTPISQIANQRIAHLGTRQEVEAMHRKGPIALRAGEKNIGLRSDVKPVADATPTEIATGYVRQLEKYPNDAEVREKLAMLYLDQFKRPDLAADQFELLAAQENEPARRIAHWLNQLATVHVRRNDLAAAEEALRRILQKYPGSPQAEMAMTRLAGIGGEIKANSSSTSLKLGNYEHDLGLKGKLKG